ncbi:MAG: TIGR02453 family protein [Alphaproteobacteria bacterium]|nr:TIGR02453 family protein [Alphaproteobacteria bacterium]
MSGRFTGFPPGAEQFFIELAGNQERSWFTNNKARYEGDVKAPMAALIEDLAEELARRAIPLTGDAKRGLFRIHRDVRFSKDKAPYKTHAGAVLTRDGRKDTPGLLYIHLDPTGSFVAAGFYHLDPPRLARIRDAIAYGPKEFLALEARLVAAGLGFSREESLSRLPRGYDVAAGGPVEWAVKLRNLVVHRPIAPEALRTPALVGDIADFAADALPLLDYGWDALS